MNDCFIIDDVLDHSLNVTMVNQFLRSDDITVTLQWPREPGAVYNVSVSPEISYTEHVSKEYTIFTMNLTIPYNNHYNVSIISSLCGVTTNKVLKYGKYTCIHGEYIIYNTLYTIISPRAYCNNFNVDIFLIWFRVEIVKPNPLLNLL